MTTPCMLLTLCAGSLLLVPLGTTAKAAPEPPRVKSVVVMPDAINDSGEGATLVVRVEYAEPARIKDTLRLTIVPGPKPSGSARWSDNKPVQSFPIETDAARTEVQVTVRVTRNGTVGIKASTSSQEESSANVYWMTATLMPD